MTTASLAVGLPAMSLDIPQTQNTAPVLEYRCMFTNDIRRKQKRWQDGRLKFHMFNKRIMVYDERSNFVGDTHWKRGSELDTGEELELDRGGILVQVDEFLKKENQDLHELITKRIKEKEERALARTATSPVHSTSFRTQSVAAHPSLDGRGAVSGSSIDALRPKALNAIIGNPTGHYGKASAPTTSPFEQRLVYRSDERPAKRQRRVDSPPSKKGYAQNLLGTTLLLKSHPPLTARSIRYEPLRISRPAQQTVANTIDLTLGDEHGVGGGSVRSHRTANKRHVNERPTTQKQNISQSPPPNGYASRLTGAALLLGMPARNHCLNHNEVSKVSVSRPHQTPVQDRSRSSPEPLDRLYETRPPKLSRTEALEKRQITSKNNFKSWETTACGSRRSSSDVAFLGITREEIPYHQNAPILELPARTASLDRPVSSLRIKSRPPRKMMMLMQQSGSTPMQRAGQTESRLSSVHEAEDSRYSAHALSQPSKCLDDFNQKQAALLAKRLKDGNSNEKVETGRTLSSTPNRGINDQSHDMILTQNARPHIIRETPPSSPKHLAKYTQNPGADLPKKSVDKHATARGPKPRFDYQDPTVCCAPESQNLLASAIKRSSSGALDLSLPSSPVLGMGAAESNSNNLNGLNASVLLAGDMIFSATDRFRAIIKSSGSSPNNSREPNLSPQPDALVLDKTSLSTSQEERNPPMSKILAKGPPEVASRLQCLQKDSINVATVQTASFKAAGLVNQNQGSSNEKLAVFQKPKISNPATGGRSILAIANQTIDTLNEASNIMPPPAASGRLQSRLQSGSGMSGKQAQRASAAAASGPWSREAFDLFGDWRPPGEG